MWKTKKRKKTKSKKRKVTKNIDDISDTSMHSILHIEAAKRSATLLVFLTVTTINKVATTSDHQRENAFILLTAYMHEVFSKEYSEQGAQKLQLLTFG